MGRAIGKQNPKRRGGFSHAAAAVVLAGGLLAACASPRPPQAFRFPSNRQPVDALHCAASRLRLEGFQVASALDTIAGVNVLADTVPPPVGSPQAGVPDADSLPDDPRIARAVPTIPIDELTAVGQRLSDTDRVTRPEWWRVELSISQNDDGTTIVHSLAGMSTRAEGPFEEPSLELQGLIGRLTMTCTW
jgi:hypothetical protein